MTNLLYTLPSTIEDYYVTGNFTDINGNEVYFEIPAIFNEDDTCDEQSTIDKMNTEIQHIEDRIASL